MNYIYQTITNSSIRICQVISKFAKGGSKNSMNHTLKYTRTFPFTHKSLSPLVIASLSITLIPNAVADITFTGIVSNSSSIPSGPSATWNAGTDLTIGQNDHGGAGSLSIGSGSTVNATNVVYVGGRGFTRRSRGGNGTLNVNGSLNTSLLSVGAFAWNTGGHGIVNLNTGGIITTNQVQSDRRGEFIFNGGTLKLSRDQLSLFNRATPWSPYTTVTLGANGGIIDTNGYNVAIASGSRGIGGAGDLTKAGAGTLTLTGANTYTGATNINAGMVQANNNSALGNNSAVTIASGAGLNLGTNVSVGSLAGAGNVDLSDKTLTTGGNNQSTTYSGVMSGTGGLDKTGNGTLTLTGANTYSGGTVVSAGTLQGNATSLQGNITNNATVVFDQNTAGTYAGVMSGTGGLDKTGNGTLTLAGANTYTGATNINAGTLSVTGSIASSSLTSVNANAALHLGNGAQVGNTTINSGGLLVINTGDRAEVVGNYTQSGTLRVGADSTNYSRLAVSGDATIAASATFDVDVTSGTTTLANGGELLGVVRSSGTLTNASASNNVTDNSYLFNFSSRTNANGQQVDLIAVAATSTTTVTPTPTLVGIVPATIKHGLLNGVPTAQVVDGYIRGGVTGTDWDDIVTALGRLPDSYTTAAAVGDMMPLLHGNTALAGLINTKASEGMIAQRQAALGASSGDVLAGATFWVRPFGQWADQDKRGSVNGFSANSHGIMMGLEHDLSAYSTLGVGLGYTDSSVHGKGFAANHRAEAKALSAVVYGQHDLANAWQLAWQGDYVRSQVDGARYIGFIDRTASSDFDAQAFHLGASVGKTFSMGEQTSLRPKAGIDWRRYEADGYTETGAGNLNLMVQSQSTQEAILSVGTELTHEIDGKTELFGHIGVGYDLIGDDQAVTSQFTGGGAAFSTAGMDSHRVSGELGLGVRYRPSEQSEISLQYNLQAKSGYTDHSASLQFGWKF